jgi:hypothetical protein
MNSLTRATLASGLALVLAACGAPEALSTASTAQQANQAQQPPATASPDSATTLVGTPGPCLIPTIAGRPAGPLGPGRFGTPERAALGDEPAGCPAELSATPSDATGGGGVSSEGPASIGPVAITTAEAVPGTGGPANLDAGGSPTPLAGPQTVGLGESGQALTLAVGETFEVKLSGSMIWAVTIGDEQVISRAPDAVGADSQGIFQALAPGETTLTAQGEAPCRREQPACMVPDVLFQLTVVVR